MYLFDPKYQFGHEIVPVNPIDSSTSCQMKCADLSIWAATAYQISNAGEKVYDQGDF